MPKPEAAARETIDHLLSAAGWVVCDAADANITGHRGVAIREFPLKRGHGFADYLLYVDGKAAGVIEAKKQGATLIGVETQSAQYTAGLPDALPRGGGRCRSSTSRTGVETRFTNGLDPRRRAATRVRVPRAGTLAAWIADATIDGGVSAATSKVAEAAPDYAKRGPTFLARMQHAAAAGREGSLAGADHGRPNLEASLGREPAARADPDGDRQRQDLHRGHVHLPADQVRRGAAGAVPGGPRQPRRQTLKEFQQYATPDDNRKFTELYNVQHLQSNTHRPGRAGRASPRSSACTRCSRARRARPDELEEGSLFEPGSALVKRAAAGRLQPDDPDRDLRRHRHRRVPPLDLQPLAAGARVLRRLPDRPDRHAASRPSASSTRTW